MTRQISEISENSDGVTFRTTSLNPLRPQNAATELENRYLQQFLDGLTDGGEFLERNGHKVFFYMAPLVTNQSCFQCHGSEGTEEEGMRGGISITLPDDDSIPFWTLLFSHLGIGLVGLLVILLVTRKLNDSYSQVQQQAVLDALTQIPNRRSFSEEILREFARSRRGGCPSTLIMCDIDHFKAYNDSYGHVAGDECLKEVAQCLKKSLQRPEDFCARYGGEEFVIILWATSLDGGVTVAERICQSIEKMQIEHKASPTSSVVTASLGVASLSENQAATYENLIKYADSALYQTKDGGRNGVCVFGG